MTEQRKNRRYDLRLPCEILRADMPRLSAETRNMSSAGVLLSTGGHIAVGEPIEYLVTFPKTPGSTTDVRLRCVGKVVREHEASAFAATLERYEFVR